MLSINEIGLLKLTYKNNNNENIAHNILFYNIMVTCIYELGSTTNHLYFLVSRSNKIKNLHFKVLNFYVGSGTGAKLLWQVLEHKKM